jgi:lysozyme
MKLIPHAKTVAWRSFSMWANYLGVLCLIAPELIFWLFERDTNPRIWWLSGLILIVLGMIGRMVNQTTDRHKLHLPALVMFLAVAVPLIAKWEGKENTAYLDRIASPPVWTVCYGETRGVKRGDRYTDAQCAKMLEAGLLEYRAGLHRYFTPETVARRLPPERDAAFTSLAWNVGIAGTGKSTATRRLNAGNIAGACEAITWWNRAGSRVVRGLVNRRADEYRFCMIGTG